MATGFVCDERYFWWDTRSAGLFMPSHAAIGVEPDAHASRRRRSAGSSNLLDLTGLIKQLSRSSRAWPRSRRSARCPLHRAHRADEVPSPTTTAATPAS